MSARRSGILRGYVTIVVRGYGLERFLRLCTVRDIVLWNLKRCGDECCRCCIHRSDFRKLRPICRKTKMHVRIEGKGGFPQLYTKCRHRFIFFAAFILMLCGVYRCSGYIWNIEITGNSYLSDENLLRFLKEQGISAGTQRSSVDTDALELLLRQSYAQVIWTSAYVEGTSLVICVREQLKTEEPVSAVQTASPDDAGAACDLVAAKNAVIASIITRKGTPCVVSGDEVMAGDILVSSACDIYNDDGEVMYSVYQQADADVYGYVDYTFSESLPVKNLIQIDTNESSTAYFIRIFDRYFCFPRSTSPYEDYYTLENLHQLRISSGFYLPVYWGTREYGQRETAYNILAKDRAQTTADADFLCFVNELEENGVLIIDKNVMIEETGSCYEVTGHVLALEPIAAAAPVEIPPDIEEETNFQ